jgi:hypothetical protein
MRRSGASPAGCVRPGPVSTVRAQADRVHPRLARWSDRVAGTLGCLRRRSHATGYGGVRGLRRLCHGPRDVRAVPGELVRHQRQSVHRPDQRHAQVRRLPVARRSDVERHPPRPRHRRSPRATYGPAGQEPHQNSARAASTALSCERTSSTNSAYGSCPSWSAVANTCSKTSIPRRSTSRSATSGSSPTARPSSPRCSNRLAP